MRNPRRINDFNKLDQSICKWLLSKFRNSPVLLGFMVTDICVDNVLTFKRQATHKSIFASFVDHSHDHSFVQSRR